MDHLLEIFTTVKGDFCQLTNYKLRGETLEIITPFTTINDKFVSVFVKKINGRYIVSDAGWVSKNYYNIDANEDSEDIIGHVMDYYQGSFNIKSQGDLRGNIQYYKSCNNLNEVSSSVFDLANFLVGAVNALGLKYKDAKEQKERESFKQIANSFLKVNYKDDVKIQNALDDFENIKFNALITKNSNIFLVSYVTGSSPYYFANDLRKSIVNFEISEKSKYRKLIKEKVSIINDAANGYRPSKISSMMELLNEKVTQAPIKWSEKEKILEII